MQNKGLLGRSFQLITLLNIGHTRGENLRASLLPGAAASLLRISSL